MVQAALDMNDTASLFRADAEGIELPAAAKQVLRRARVINPNANNDDEDELDDEGNSDRAILARKSGYRITDEMTMQGVMNENNESGGSGGKGAQYAAAARMMSSSSSTPSWVSQASDWVSRTASSVGTAISNAGRSVMEFGSNVWNSATEMLGNATSTISGMWTSVKDGASALISNPGETISNAWTATKNTASSLTTSALNKGGELLTSARDAVTSTASSAWSSTKSFFGYGDQPQQAAATPATPAATASKPAEAQPLAGQKSNPSTGWSLGGMFESAANAVGLGNDDPAPAAARPAPRAAHTP